MASVDWTSLWARVGSRNSEGSERRGAQQRPAQRGSKQRALKIASIVTWSDTESRQPSLPEESDHRAIGRSSYELFAASVGNPEWLRFCLNQDPEEIATDDKGFAATHFAAQGAKLACLKVLIEEYKFPVDLRTSKSQTPLHLVIHRDNKAIAIPCIRYLLEQGAALNAQTCNGSTPLHLAAREGLLACVKFLVQSGADVHARDAMGCKPIDLCKIWNHRTCARFLKDAMWKRDKKDFACEMGKLKKLKDQLIVLEQNYLAEYQKQLQLLRKADYRKWLHCKQLLGQRHSLNPPTKQEASAPPRTIALSMASEYQGLQPSKHFHPFAKVHRQCIPQPNDTVKPIYPQQMVRRPEMWNSSNNPARPPTTQISYPQGIRMSVHPDPSGEHDFSSFLKVTPDRHGGARLRTVDGHWVAPVPRLPFEVVVRALYPQVQPYRMKVPQGLYPISMQSMSGKRHLGNDNFWTDALAMSLRETFDEAFLETMRAHGGLPALPSPKAPL
ncbi:ankyrin repeat domain-containing protein 53 [Tupaia chinensis]|uniref:Ankyrin repeat domain-containing protein 53 n=1 Tax=Tupaia chinensis TaxID=246437 RepID=L9KS87_TUPCH|nr:ankyrin repeat domain-containing protein 53 [Tupaia chinensis]ELW64052.1 Ankyrin repeat domain-containing protein 53 [Tupaia chinensis]